MYEITFQYGKWNIYWNGVYQKSTNSINEAKRVLMILKKRFGYEYMLAKKK